MSLPGPEPIVPSSPELPGAGAARPPGSSGVGALAPVMLLASATFLGAFLLFFVQPLIARFVLPWFGGSAGVWTTCLLFFQVCLLAGYAYAHGLTQWLSPRTQVKVHAGMLVAAVLLLPIVPGAEWKPTPDAAPAWHLLRLLAVCIGLPFLVLATTGPLLQAWFNRLRPGQSPYRLYALSNAGSLVALLSHPFLFEPWLPRTTQATGWGWAFGLYAMMILGVGGAVWRMAVARDFQGGEAPGPAPSTQEPPGGQFAAGSDGGTPWGIRLLWLALPACATVLLMAVSNKLCEDLASVPFLWVLPLGLYLITFILSFDSPAWYWRGLFQTVFWLWLPAMAYAVVRYDRVPWPAHVVVYSVGLLAGCMVCHGELYRLRPAPRELTRFYLMIAAGGALGGGFVALGAPLFFDGYLELYAGVLMLAVLLVVIHAKERVALLKGGHRFLLWPVTLGGTVLLAVLLSVLTWAERYKATESHRDFYGVFRILELQEDNPLLHARVFMSGGTIHGAQYRHPVKSTWPTTYYARGSGVGLLFEQTSPPRRIGIVGLGIGSLSAYGQAGDVIRFYELSPYVAEVARTRFSHLGASAARIEVVLGDARLSLEAEAPQGFDILVLDAFTSDAIPVHLLTREMFDIYRRHLKPGGVLAIHVSNRHLDLEPVVRRHAAYLGLPSVNVPYRPGADRPEGMSSNWMLITDNPTLLALPALRFSRPEAEAAMDESALWTDDHVSLLPLLRKHTPTGSREPAGR